jgi:methionyl-tRNA formyltransferase
MEVVRALDAGPMVATIEEAIRPSDTTGSLEERLATAGAGLLGRTITPWANGEIAPQPQDEALVTYAPQLKREDARLDWSRPAVDLWRQVRAFNPWPVAFTSLEGEDLRVFEAWPLAADSDANPGTILGLEALPSDAGSTEPGLAVQTGEGRLGLTQIQRPGRRKASGSEFFRGRRDLAGRRLG